jgi:hypothetical protein
MRSKQHTEDPSKYLGLWKCHSFTYWLTALAACYQNRPWACWILHKYPLEIRCRYCHQEYAWGCFRHSDLARSLTWTIRLCIACNDDSVRWQFAWVCPIVMSSVYVWQPFTGIGVPPDLRGNLCNRIQRLTVDLVDPKQQRTDHLIQGWMNHSGGSPTQIRRKHMPVKFG